MVALYLITLELEDASQTQLLHPGVGATHLSTVNYGSYGSMVLSTWSWRCSISASVPVS